MKHKSRPITQPEIDAFIASAALWLAWLAGVILSLGAPRRGRRLHRFVKRCERWVESIVVLMAMHRLAPAPQRTRHRFAPPGFRRSESTLRLFFKSARIRARNAGLRRRVMRLIEALSCPEPHIAHFVRCFRRGLHKHRLVAAAPPAHACADLACPPVAFADSS